VRGIGAKTALRLVQACGRVERIFEGSGGDGGGASEEERDFGGVKVRLAPAPAPPLPGRTRRLPRRGARRRPRALTRRPLAPQPAFQNLCRSSPLHRLPTP
jgi:hypothetical protein